MANFESHLQRLSYLITVEKHFQTYFENDFEIIRKYVVDILGRDPRMKSIMVTGKSKFCYDASPFLSSLVMDLTHLMSFAVKFSKGQAPFLDIIRKHDKKLHKIYLPPFPFIIGHQLNAEATIEFIRKLIEKGFQHSGCFVRGHQNEVYELELSEDKDRLKHCITINAISDIATLSIDFRILIILSHEWPPPTPFPLNNNKINWLAAIDKRSQGGQIVFALCVPKMETDLGKIPHFLAAYRLLRHLLSNLDYRLHDVFLLSPLYELVLYKKSSNCCNTIAEVMDHVLRRILKYFQNNVFPFYWNTNKNLLNTIEKQSRLAKNLSDLLGCIVSMQHNKKLTFDEVQDFFGIEVNSELFKIDCFSIFKSFK